jgi:hypothetical protein
MFLKKLLHIFSLINEGSLLNRIKVSEIGSRLARGTFWSMAGSVIPHGLMLGASVLVA